MNSKIQRYIAVMIIGILVIFCFETLSEQIMINADENKLYIVEKMYIGKYKNNISPKLSGEAYRDWIFAGWYKDENCHECITDKSKYTGKQYAKFISEKVLSVVCQNLEGTSNLSSKTNLRLVTTVDSLYYSKIGFEIFVGDKSETVESRTVYKSISAKSNEVKFDYKPNVFHYSSNYFATVTLTNIPKNNFATGIYIKPYLVTLDGTKVYGVGRYVRIEDSWENIVNVPIRVSTYKEVAAGKFNVEYDNKSFEYVGNNKGDLGHIFDEMYINDIQNGLITCVGNTSPIKDTVADGMIVSLRFKKIKNDISESLFIVNEEEFINYEEKHVFISQQKFDISDVKYYLIGK